MTSLSFDGPTTLDTGVGRTGPRAVSADNPLPTTPGVAGPLSDLSGTVSAGGTAQTLAANARRTRLFIANPHASEDLWLAILGHTAAPNAAGSIRLAANGGYADWTGAAPTGAVSLYAATTGHPFTAWEG